VQAEYVGQAALRALEAPRVTLLIQYLYRDEPGLERFQSGLVYRDGVAKPALAAFEVPLAQVSREGTATRLWGQLRPGTGVRRYLLQRFQDGRWYSVGNVASTDGNGYFRRTVNAPPGALFRVRAVQANLTSAVLRVT
jgi:hypothetical protein